MIGWAEYRIGNQHIFSRQGFVHRDLVVWRRHRSGGFRARLAEVQCVLPSCAPIRARASASKLEIIDARDSASNRMGERPLGW